MKNEQTNKLTDCPCGKAGTDGEHSHWCPQNPMHVTDPCTPVVGENAYGWICPVCGTVNNPTKLTCCKVNETGWTTDTKDIQE